MAGGAIALTQKIHRPSSVQDRSSGVYLRLLLLSMPLFAAPQLKGCQPQPLTSLEAVGVRARVGGGPSRREPCYVVRVCACFPAAVFIPLILSSVYIFSAHYTFRCHYTFGEKQYQVCIKIGSDSHTEVHAGSFSSCHVHLFYALAPPYK